MVPYIIQSTVAYLTEHGPSVPGIFRVSGSSRRVRMVGKDTGRHQPSTRRRRGDQQRMPRRTARLSS